MLLLWMKRSLARSTISKSHGQVMILSENDRPTGYRGGLAFLVKHVLDVNKEYRNNDFNIITNNEALNFLISPAAEHENCAHCDKSMKFGTGIKWYLTTISGYGATSNSLCDMYFADQNEFIYRTSQMHFVGWCWVVIIWLKRHIIRIIHWK